MSGKTVTNLFLKHSAPPNEKSPSMTATIVLFDCHMSQPCVCLVLDAKLAQFSVIRRFNCDFIFGKQLTDRFGQGYGWSLQHYFKFGGMQFCESCWQRGSWHWTQDTIRGNWKRWRHLWTKVYRNWKAILGFYAYYYEIKSKLLIYKISYKYI